MGGHALTAHVTLDDAWLVDWVVYFYDSDLILTLVWIGLAVSGVLFQFLRERKRPPFSPPAEMWRRTGHGVAAASEQTPLVADASAMPSTSSAARQYGTSWIKCLPLIISLAPAYLHVYSDLLKRWKYRVIISIDTLYWDTLIQQKRRRKKRFPREVSTHNDEWKQICMSGREGADWCLLWAWREIWKEGKSKRRNFLQGQLLSREKKVKNTPKWIFVCHTHTHAHLHSDTHTQTRNRGECYNEGMNHVYIVWLLNG